MKKNITRGKTLINFFLTRLTCFKIYVLKKKEKAAQSLLKARKELIWVCLKKKDRLLFYERQFLKKNNLFTTWYKDIKLFLMDV
jgi:hypothetical protein